MSFQKISTVIQNILIKSISHSVNFTIPDLKPHTGMHRIYTHVHFESVISSIDSNRSNSGSGGTRPGNELRLKLVHHQRIRTWNLTTAIEPRPRTPPTRSMMTAIIVVTIVEIFIKPVRANSDLTAILIFPWICDIFDVFNIHTGMKLF